MSAQTHEFRAETRKVLHILTHSLYTNREIFLRELISNASDALDKARFLQAGGENLRSPELPLEIRIEPDKINNILNITDTGVGMTPEEMTNNLGTIARSGSEEFLAAMTRNNETRENGETRKDSDATQIIGRFGIGFYSVFMVADKVEVISVPATGEGAPYLWTSDGEGAFTVEALPEDRADEAPARGTRIRAWLKEDAHDFLEKYRIESIVRAHSAFVPFPVLLDGERLNTTPAIWREPKSSVTREQYDQFYTWQTNDATPPAEVVHLSVDAPAQFSALLFIPAHGDPFMGVRRDDWGPDLYVRRVLIQRQQKELLPDYLSFVKGVVDSEDLPLNISRETLQENAILRTISKTITKQVLTRLEELAARDAEAYNTFWRNQGRVLKLGYSDYLNRERIIPLLRFSSSTLEPVKDADGKDVEGLTALAGYAERMKSGQKHIWFLAAPSREAAMASPHLEAFRRKGLEVLFLYEPVDEFALESLGSFTHDKESYSFKAVEHADSAELDAFPDTADAAPRPEQTPLDNDDMNAFDALLAEVKTVLGDRIVDVRVSRRLTDSPACLTTPGEGVTSSMDRIMRVLQKDDSIPKKIFEINRDHPMWRDLLRMHKTASSNPLISEMVEALFDNAMLMDGYMQNPLNMTARNARLLEKLASLA